MFSDDGTNAVNWVERKALCTLDTAFLDLRVQVSKDVEVACLYNKTGWDFQFKDNYISTPLKSFSVLRNVKGYSGDSVSVHFELRRDFILVGLSNHQKFEIELAWDEQTATCDFRVDGKILKLWQISQRSLFDLFFNS